MANGKSAAGAAEVAPNYEFFRRKRGRLLVRRARDGGRLEQLVNGRWVRRRSSELDRDSWAQLSEPQLRSHRRRYVVELEAPQVPWSHPRERLARARLACILFPPLKGGARRRGLKTKAVERSRRSYQGMFAETGLAELELMEAQALLGLEHQRARVSGAEQRANVFLAGAGLTTTALLANASFLIGEDKLDGGWRTAAVAVLIATSVCALFSGLRALQAVMTTFSRTPPNAIGRILGRREEEDPAGVHRSYLAALLVGQARTTVVGDWKIARMSEARRWFFGLVLGTLGLTVCVLFGAVF